MHSGTALPIVTPDTPMSDALLEITAKHFGCVAVSDDAKNLLGVITDGDLRRHMTDDLIKKHARDIMTTGAKTIVPNALAVEALTVMNEKAITSLFVCDENNHIQGILHIHDCLRNGIA